MHRCRICGSDFHNNEILLNEMMFGTSESFVYCSCPVCECLQIVEIPALLSKYYPQNYYSYNKSNKISLLIKLKHLIINGISLIKRSYYKAPYFEKYSIDFQDRKKRIADIGCGDGKLLKDMRLFGFKKLYGYDIFANNSLNKKKIKIKKETIHDAQGKFDIIMAHHVLEHDKDPLSFIKQVAALLHENGKFILRVPIYPNYIWDKYGTNWVQLDPPRHLYTFSKKTIEILCSIADLEIKKMVYDGEPWAIASSELITKGETHWNYNLKGQTSESHIVECNHENALGNGDSAMFIIKHSTQNRMLNKKT